MHGKQMFAAAAAGFVLFAVLPGAAQAASGAATQSAQTAQRRCKFVAKSLPTLHHATGQVYGTDGAPGSRARTAARP
jgi:hypothetical protein